MLDPTLYLQMNNIIEKFKYIYIYTYSNTIVIQAIFHHK